ncbi:PKD domain-containing protein [Aquimonas voraii]|uniref:PKD domain-containing protein n=1 Tax=Aquimonas voraii TaxID=265719 RepID=A0A1G6UGG7_9GAMM|nr:PKD domain-containing protein [Aquimonas voraii]SDD40500.1 PKD domain-containing protein [Aquimonas voraii]
MKALIVFLLFGAVLGSATATADVAPGGAGDTAPLASIDPQWLPRFATAKGSAPVACADSPFGRYATMGEDAEYVSMIASTNLRSLQVYAPGPANGDVLVQEFSGELLQSGNVAGSDFLTATEADLNGDGRDELITAHRAHGSGWLRLGVFRRGSNGSVSLLQTWNFPRTFSHVEIKGGDLDGSADGAQELAILIQGTNPAALEVYVLTGNAQGLIAENTSGGWSGRWTLSGTFPASSLAIGDMILSGREQMVVVNESGSGGTRALNYHLLEFQPTTTALPRATNSVAIGSRSFVTSIGTGFETDNGTSMSIQSIRSLRALAGDITDSAAAELMVLVLVEGSSNFNRLFARMHHFTTVRDANNTITAIDFFSRDAQRPWDSSYAVSGENQGALIKFDAAFANIDQISPSEFVLAIAESQDNRLRVDAYKARVELTAGFQWQRNGRTVSFTDRSTGRVNTRRWNFGDNSGPLTDLNPTYTFAAAGTYNVTLTVTGFDGQTMTRTHQVVVADTGSGSGGAGPETRYAMDSTPSYAAHLAVESAASLGALRLAVGDMDKQGIAEVMTLVNDRSQQLIRSLWRLGNPALPGSFAGRHLATPTAGLENSGRLVLLAADTDGDSVRARLGADCRQVEEPQVRQLVWHPPYFERLQGDAEKQAAFGQTISGQTSREKRAGSFTSHDVSAYVGVSAGFDILGVGVETSVKATAGYNYQASKGAIHGSENGFALNQGFSSSFGEALMIVEENSFRCYSYDIRAEASGVVPNSGMRMCEVVEDSRGVSATTAQFWDTTVAAAGGAAPPAQWTPLHRDWASLSLFQPVTTNVTPASGSSAASVTDGRFSTWLASSASRSLPYVQIDLGEVQEISNIRVFPRAGRAIDLRGFRVFASETPMSGDALPTGAGVRSFAPETGDDMAFDRWNIWTRNPAAPSQMLRARYIRLQHPGTAVLNVAQIQVFGDVHVEPHRYPQDICDPNRSDNTFLARMWNPRSSGWANIEVRGEILWNGSGDMDGCSNFSGMQRWNIWADLFVGNPGTSSWNLSQEGGNYSGDYTGFESSNRVGAEFDIEAGFIANVQAGAAYEYSFGVTEEVQTLQYWGSGLEMGGTIAGFAPEFGALVGTCRYTPRPYAYRLMDYSNTGYEHTVFVVDYVVRQGSANWQRSNVPEVCLNIQRPPEVFANGFE